MCSNFTCCSAFMLVFGIVSTIVSIAMLAGGYDAVYNAILHKKYQVVPGTEVNEIWTNIPVPMEMKVYIFNITNPDDFLKGENPILQEVGPYVYSEFHHKENVSYHSNGTVTYFQKRWWVWDQDKSGNNTLDDVVTVLNAVPVSAAFAVADRPTLMTGLNNQINSVDEPAIVETTASRIIFEGYQDPLLDLVHTVANISDSFASLFPPGLLSYDKFAWFYNRNESLTYDGIYNMFTGETGLDDVGLIDWWNYSDSTHFFDAPCNQVTGSAGEFWPPNYVTDFIEFYNSDLCMTPKLYYLEDIEDSYGIPGRRYWGSNITFANSSVIPENECYCINDECGPNGLLNAQTCRMGAPAFVSFPHFLNAEPELLQSVSGLSPDPDRHSFFMDINPELGIPLRVAARIQINIQVTPYPCGIVPFGCIKILDSVPEVILPMIWFEVLSQMTDDLAEEIKPALFFASSFVITLLFCLFLIAGVMLVGISLYFVRRRSKQYV